MLGEGLPSGLGAVDEVLPTSFGELLDTVMNEYGMDFDLTMNYPVLSPLEAYLIRINIL